MSSINTPSNARHEQKVARLLRMLEAHQKGDAIVVEEEVAIETREPVPPQKNTVQSRLQDISSMDIQSQAKLMVSLALKKYEKQQMARSQPVASSEQPVAPEASTKEIKANRPASPRLASYLPEADVAPLNHEKPATPFTQDAKRKSTLTRRPIDSPTDPRWVFAIKVSEKMEGPILRPEHREKLIRLAKSLGLSAFDGNMIIAIVQDQARRGHPAGECPAASREQLEMIQLARPQTPLKKKLIASIVLAILTAELIAIGFFF